MNVLVLGEKKNLQVMMTLCKNVAANAYVLLVCVVLQEHHFCTSLLTMQTP